MWLIKYIGYFLFSYSTSKTAATILGEAEMYNCSVSPVLGLSMVSKLFKCSLAAKRFYSAPRTIRTFCFPIKAQ